MRFAFVTGLVLLTLASCQSDGPALNGTVRSQGTAAVPAPATSISEAPALFKTNWSTVAVGQEPPFFRDPSQDGERPYWLAPGKWAVTKVRTPAYSGLVYQASEEKPQPYLSFRVLQTPQLPNRYQVKVTIQPVSSPHFKSPVGEISIIPYFRDPTHYLEVLVTNDNLGLWLADGAEPDTDRGWTGLHFLPVHSQIGRLQTITIDMDLDARHITVQCGDVTYDLDHEFLAPGRGHKVAVRSAGNTFNLVDLQVGPHP